MSVHRSNPDWTIPAEEQPGSREAELVPPGPATPPGVPRITIRAIPKGYAGTRVTVEQIKRLIREGAKDFQVRQHAIDILLARGIRPKDYLGEIKALFEYVQSAVRYTKDPYRVETLHSARRLLSLMAGDCDDECILLGSLLEAVGHPVRIVLTGPDPTRPQLYSHVYLEAFCRGRWIPLDPTAAHPMGWQPRAFIKKIFSLHEAGSWPASAGRAEETVAGREGPVRGSDSRSMQPHPSHPDGPRRDETQSGAVASAPCAAPGGACGCGCNHNAGTDLHGTGGSGTIRGGSAPSHEVPPATRGSGRIHTTHPGEETTASRDDNLVLAGLQVFRRYYGPRSADLLTVRHDREIPPVVIQLGALTGIIYRSDRHEPGAPRTYIHFMRQSPTLATNVEGTRLYILGGEYRVTTRGIEG